MILEKVENTIKSHKLINKGDKVLIGVSGGPDSVCLLDLLFKIKDKRNLKISIIHINHGLRGKDSEKDQALVNNLAKKYQIPIIIKKINVKNYQKKNKLSLEEAARDLRHQVFSLTCQQKKINRVVLAHTSSDQVETVLMNFLRGAGINGLSGMNYHKDFKVLTNNKRINFQIIRPLLDCSKKEILAYLKQEKLKFNLDKTNFDLNFTRNRIRHEIIPAFKKINPSIEENILAQAKLFQDLSQSVETTIKPIIKSSHFDKDRSELSLKKWKRLNGFYKKEAILAFLRKFSSTKDIYSSQIEEIVDLLENSSTGSYKILPFGLVIYKNYDKLIISYKNLLLDKKKIKKQKLKITGITELPEIQAKIETNFSNKKKSENQDTAFVDLKKTGKDIFVRSRKPGDRFKPTGFRGGKKVQDFLIDAKIPKFLRNDVPILVDKKDRIIWLGGLRQDRQFIASENSKQILIIKFNNEQKDEKQI